MDDIGGSLARLPFFFFFLALYLSCPAAGPVHFCSARFLEYDKNGGLVSWLVCGSGCVRRTDGRMKDMMTCSNSRSECDGQKG